MPTEIATPKMNREEGGNFFRRDSVMDEFKRLKLVIDGDKFPAVGTLAPGRYKGASLTTSSNVTGVGDARVEGEVSFLSTGVLRNITFAEQVRVGASANVVFIGCVFLMPITVTTGGVIGCVGCRFDGTSAIPHSGPAPNANRVGCVGTSALAGDGPNVTIIGGI